ncbi:MAG: alpha/beta hydrolase [Devosia sp.]
MDFRDDTLEQFDAQGAAPLPATSDTGLVGHDGARIWYASYGAGPAVILLHGGLGNAGNFGHQVPALLAVGYRAIVIDSRGHGRSTRDAKPYSYELMGSDVLAVMDHLGVDRAALIGWSDGACTASILADRHPERRRRVLFRLQYGSERHAAIRVHSDHWPLPRAASEGLCGAVIGTRGVGQLLRGRGPDAAHQPNYTAADLARIAVPVAVVLGEGDEFIRREHAQYLAANIPGATLTILPVVTHFAPLQRPAEFNRVMQEFARSVS